MKTLPSYSFDELKNNPPQVLLLGNGINRAFDFGSWGDLMASLFDTSLAFTDEERKCIEKMAYPMQADICTGNAVNGRLNEKAKELIGMSPCGEEQTLLQRLLSLPFGAVLTTNYTYEVEKSVVPDAKMPFDNGCPIRKKTDPHDNKKLFSYLDVHAAADEVKYDRLYTYMDLGDHYPPLWHVHGEAGINKSMVIGQHYYGKMIAYARAYSYGLSNKVKTAKADGTPIQMESWVDWFMLGDVTIIGHGMDPAEYDLWWLVSEKKKHYKDTKITWHNANTPMESKLLARAYGINVLDEKVDGDAFKQYYENLTSKIKLER